MQLMKMHQANCSPKEGPNSDALRLQPLAKCLLVQKEAIPLPENSEHLNLVNVYFVHLVLITENHSNK